MTTSFDAVAYFGDRADRYEDEAFGGSGLTYVSELELDAMERALGSVAGRHVLDVGCGTGRIVRRLLVGGAQVAALDGAPAMAERVRRAHPEVDVRVARLGEPLPFATAAFDAVVALRVLKYLPDWAFALEELQRVIRPGGRLVIEMANARSLARFGYGRSSVRTVTVGQARQELARAGFAVCSVAGGTRLPHVAWRWAASAGRRDALARLEKAAAALAPRAATRSLVLGATAVPTNKGGRP